MHVLKFLRVRIAGLNSQRNTDCEIDQKEYCPQHQERQRVRQHHRCERSDTGALNVALAINNDQREIWHEWRDDIGAGIADSVSRLR